MKSEEQKELIRFLGILLAVVVVVLGIYFFTKKFVTKEKDEETTETPAVGTVNYDMAIVGNMLSKPEKEYYVFIYSDAVSRDMYNVMQYVTEYENDTENEKKLRVYNVELTDYLNKDYKIKDDETSNPKAKDISEFKFGDITLLRIKNGKITKYIEKADDIKKELGIKDED